MDQHTSRFAGYGKSDKGLVRAGNEDAYAIRPESGLCVVSDGMGGAAAGEVASRMFVDTALDIFPRDGCRHDGQAAELVRKAFGLANRAILRHARENPQHAGMGCTGEILLLREERYIVGHVGDSRTYILRDGELKQLTRDHSFVQVLVEQGVITSAEARRHRYRNMILRAVGTNDTLAVDLLSGKLFAGDLFLMCSDGLTNMIEAAEIQAALSSPEDLAHKVDGLIEQANAYGGTDNITVVLAGLI